MLVVRLEPVERPGGVADARGRSRRRRAAGRRPARPRVSRNLRRCGKPPRVRHALDRDELLDRGRDAEQRRQVGRRRRRPARRRRRLPARAGSNRSTASALRSAIRSSTAMCASTTSAEVTSPSRMARGECERGQVGQRHGALDAYRRPVGAITPVRRRTVSQRRSLAGRGDRIMRARPSGIGRVGTALAQPRYT